MTEKKPNYLNKIQTNREALCLHLQSKTDNGYWLGLQTEANTKTPHPYKMVAQHRPDGGRNSVATQSTGARFTKYLTIYLKIIVSLS